MNIRITHGRGWYEDLEGEEYWVIRTERDQESKLQYVVDQSRFGSYHWIHEDDCEVIEEMEV